MSENRRDVHPLLNDRLDWNLLRTFRVIGQELSISRAAARLHLNRPSARHSSAWKNSSTAS
jgi:hypothetical protein